MSLEGPAEASHQGSQHAVPERLRDQSTERSHEQSAARSQAQSHEPTLRSQLLGRLLVPLFLLLVADSFISYQVALSFSQRAYDHALIEIAREISLHLSNGKDGPDLDLPEAARRVLLSDPSDTLFFE